MSCEDAALTDDERRLMDTIEADLDREMTVEPSADFAARVRARISEADRDSGRSVPWVFAAAAVVMIGTGILFATLRDAPPHTSSPAIAAGHDVPLPAPRSPLSPVVAGRIPDARSVPQRRALTPPPAEPEVLVPDDFRLAIGRVMEMVRAGTLKEQAFVSPTPAPTERAPGAPGERATAAVEEPAVGVMVVEELQVLPLNPAGGGVEKGFGLD